MQTKEGKVSGLAQFSETTNQNSFLHLAGLLDDQPFRLMPSQTPVIHHGDRLRVVGILASDGVFDGYAFTNLTNRTRGGSEVFFNLLLGLIFAAVGLGAAVAFIIACLKASFTALFFLIFVLGFGGAGLCCLREGLRARQAKAELDRTSLEADRYPEPRARS
ncbi:hypothetical protein LJR225_005142 [Phenylobacterium sp. LjRoot225]|uniref:hypothetical protein n=1 Tax=Phenylobacterium sp. LjRoot225 TaxID=3342285 RepID=UPI003ECF4B6F